MEINNCSAWRYSLRRSAVPQKFWTIIIFGIPYCYQLNIDRDLSDDRFGYYRDDLAGNLLLHQSVGHVFGDKPGSFQYPQVKA